MSDRTTAATASVVSDASLYDRDFYAWAMTQAAALREGRVADLDVSHLIDEVGGIAQQEADKLQEKLERLTHQLLLWDFWTGSRSPSRAETIRHQRRRVLRVLAHSPSLSDRRNEILSRAYLYGRLAALREAENLPMSTLPADNPYSWDEAMDRRLDSGEPSGMAG